MFLYISSTFVWKASCEYLNQQMKFTVRIENCVINTKTLKIFKSAQIFFLREGAWRVQSLLNDDGIFFTAGFSNFFVQSLQYTYHETLKATEICIKNSKIL